MALRRLSLRSVVPLILAGDVGQLPPCVMTADEKILEGSSMKRFDLNQKVSILEPSMRTGWPCWDMRRQNRIVNGGFNLALSVFYYELKPTSQRDNSAKLEAFRDSFSAMDTLFSVVFPSAEAAKQACDNYAKTVGFALSIRKTTWLDDGSSVKKRILSCAKGRKYVSYTDPNTHLTKRRSSATQMTCCPFRLWIKSSGSGAYIIEPGQTTDHNHPFAPKVAFPKFRKETILRYEDKIIAMYSSGSTPIQIARFVASEVSKA
ncbi:unnamed protein product [Clonostachys rosea f. rosea IK726]|uniref:Uncharacterized protein n=1 Tax=Clonostachys rosea f. rosea IK726 TaxID=1349383 RepID=A0ACA9U722_BIOOC|nr:unnamed protein product [Clonostachys rosea f. rosea IK726]